MLSAYTESGPVYRAVRWSQKDRKQSTETWSTQVQGAGCRVPKGRWEVGGRRSAHDTACPGEVMIAPEFHAVRCRRMRDTAAAIDYLIIITTANE